MDITKLCKLMELTTSTFDGEVLNAIRMANSEILRYNLTWTHLLSNKVINVEAQTKHPHDSENTEDVSIDEMLSECLKRVESESGLEFIKSLNKWYKITGKLSDKQIEALRKWYIHL